MNSEDENRDTQAKRIPVRFIAGSFGLFLIVFTFGSCLIFPRGDVRHFWQFTVLGFILLSVGNFWPMNRKRD